jgi:hypothetical protein
MLRPHAVWLKFGLSALAAFFLVAAAAADIFHFATGSPDLLMAGGARLATTGKLAVETADDFLLPNQTTLETATFTGLIKEGPTSIVGKSTVGVVSIEIYRVFPLDSTDPPAGNSPTRVNSPGDTAFTSADSMTGTLTMVSMTTLNSGIAVSNSVLNGISAFPNQETGGDGSVFGAEVQLTVTFTPPVVLAPGHYFFVPQVQVTGGDFYWLSAPNPIVSPGTPFAGDSELWIRNANIAPDWLRIGTDIVGGDTNPPQFNGTFSLDGTFVAPAPPPPPPPAPAAVPALSPPGLAALALLLGAAAMVLLRRRRAAA